VGGKAAGAEKPEIQDTVVVQNIYPSTSLPMEQMSESYMAINTFSQISTVIFQTNTPFFVYHTSIQPLNYASEPFIL
jgi:hypothetical protein